VVEFWFLRIPDPPGGLTGAGETTYRSEK
jgi:hypothetical protein